MASNLIIAGVGVMLAAQRGALPAFDPARLFPTNVAEPAGFIFLFAFVSAAAALALPNMLRAATTTEAAAGPVARAMAPFLFQMALAESGTLMGLMSAVILPETPVVERLFIPLLMALVVSARAYPSDARVAALAGPGAPGRR